MGFFKVKGKDRCFWCKINWCHWLINPRSHSEGNYISLLLVAIQLRFTLRKTAMLQTYNFLVNSSCFIGFSLRNVSWHRTPKYSLMKLSRKNSYASVAAGQYFQNVGTRKSTKRFLMFLGKECTCLFHSFLPACSLSYSFLSTIPESLMACDKLGSINFLA